MIIDGEPLTCNLIGVCAELAISKSNLFLTINLGQLYCFLLLILKMRMDDITQPFQI